MKPDPTELEQELEDWLNSDSSASAIRSALEEDTEVPGERTIADKVIDSVLHGADSDKVVQLETRVRRWQFAAVLASAACLVFGIFALSKSPPFDGDTGSDGPPKPPVVAEQNKPSVKRVASVSKVGPKVSDTRKKLSAMSSRNKFWSSPSARL